MGIPQCHDSSCLTELNTQPVCVDKCHQHATKWSWFADASGVLEAFSFVILLICPKD